MTDNRQDKCCIRNLLPFLLIMLCVLLLTGYKQSVQVKTVLATPAVRETVISTPSPQPTPSVRPTVSTPPKFQSTETLPPESQQLINPKKATYERLGFDKEQKKALEETAAEGKKMPVLYVTTDGGEYILSRTEYSSCVIDVFNCPEEWALDEASAGIRVRGNSSGYYGDEEKSKANPVPYRIKFDKKTNLLGLNSGAKCKSWVLLKAGYDVIRNDFAFRLGRTIMGDHAFCSDSTLVHVYVNDVYQGLYSLCEQCQVNEHRVNIAEPKKGYTGVDIGYYLVIDNNPEYPLAFQVDYGKQWTTDIEGIRRQFVPTAYTVKSDVYTLGQIDFIAQYINYIFEIVYQACEKGKCLGLDVNFDLVTASGLSAQEAVEAVLDVESVVNMYLLYEIMHDYDVGERSFYLCVDFSENSLCPRLQFTSPWNFNWTCEGRTNRYWAGAFSETGFVGQNGDRTNPWFVILIKQEWFRDLVKQKWTELSAKNAIAGCLDAEIEILETYKTELEAWHGNAVNAAYNVIIWLKNRIDWMNTQFLLPDTL